VLDNRYVKPDSALVRAADDLLTRHTGQPGAVCASCGQPSPCASARHAAEVRLAAGLADSRPAVTLGKDPAAANGGGYPDRESVVVTASNPVVTGSNPVMTASNQSAPHRFAMEQRGTEAYGVAPGPPSNGGVPPVAGGFDRAPDERDDPTVIS
jgi:hypothetical protein